MIFNKDQYDFSITNDIVIITANDMFNDILRHDSFMLAATTDTMKRILSFLSDDVSALAVDDFSNASGDFGTFVIYDEEGESTSIPVYECRLPGNQLRITDKDEINGIKALIRDLIRDYAAEMQLPLNFMYTKNHRVYSEKTLAEAMLNMNTSILENMVREMSDIQSNGHFKEDDERDKSFSIRSGDTIGFIANKWKSLGFRRKELIDEYLFGEKEHPIEVDIPHYDPLMSSPPRLCLIPWTPSSHMDNKDTGYRKVRDLRSIISLGRKYRTPSVKEINKAISECIPASVINSKFKIGKRKVK